MIAARARSVGATGKKNVAARITIIGKFGFILWIIFDFEKCTLSETTHVSVKS
jgi:hypothetical protein